MADSVGPVVLPADDAEALASAEMALQAGGIVGLPTETVYGLAVLPRPAALQALLAAKQRSEEKGVALLIDSLAQVEDLVVVAPTARRLAMAVWPGPLTLVLPLLQPGTPTLLTGGRDTLALRLPDHVVPRALARRLGPIATTSANRSGEAPARSAAELIEVVGASLALVLDDGPVAIGVASTVVAVDTEGAVRVLREGALARADVETLISGDR